MQLDRILGPERRSPRKAISYLLFWNMESHLNTVESHMNTKKLNNWFNGVWSIPDLGMLRILPTMGGIRMLIYKEQTTDFDNWKKGKLEELAKLFSQELTPPLCEEHNVILDESLGRDFFMGRSARPTFVDVLSVKYSATGWEFELQSAVTTDKAVISLDSSFKVLQAFRNNKQVYPVTSEVPKDK